MGKTTCLILVTVFVLATLPFSGMAADIPVNVYEDGANGNPVAVPGVKVEAFGGYGFKALLSSGMTGSDGSCVLNNVPLGKEVAIKLTKAGYITEYDIRSFSETDVDIGAVLWTGSEANVKALYTNLGETFDVKKGQVYLEINDELTGEGIEGVQLSVSSGNVFDLGQGEYLIANAGGASLMVGIQKPGHTFDMASVTIPLFAGTMTQTYAKVQNGGAVIESGQVTAVTRASISGHITEPSTNHPISGVTVNFMTGTQIAGPPAVTDSTGFYMSAPFPQPRAYKVIPQGDSLYFNPAARIVFVGANGGRGDFKGFNCPPFSTNCVKYRTCSFCQD